MATQSEALPWLRLAIAAGFAGPLDPERPQPLLAPEAEPEDFFTASEAELEARGVPPAVRARLRSAKIGAAAGELLARTEAAGLVLLHRGHPLWPAALEGLPDAPLVLWARGRPEVLGRGPAFTVVGTRCPTPYGVDSAGAFARALGLAGFVLVSGLARGIDGLAHRAALECGAPTAAVLGGGADRIYPREHEALAAEILRAGGLLLAERPPGCPPRPASFPRRNRILVALGRGLLVVEAGRRSGSLHSAAWALAYDRPIWAVPGPWNSPASEGCHKLVREGAGLADSPEGLLQDLGLAFDLGRGPGPIRLDDPLEAALLQALGGGPRPPDVLATHVGRPLAKVLAALERLVARGLLSESFGAYRLRGATRTTR